MKGRFQSSQKCISIMTIKHYFTLVTVSTLAFLLPGNLMAAGLGVLETGKSDEWTITFNDKPIMVYSFSKEKSKPYVKELYTLTGDNILRDSPPDHVHHRGLMYAIKVNGTNFWEEQSGHGIERAIHTSKPMLGTNTAGVPEAAIHQTIHWLSPSDASLTETTPAALLIEQRTLTLSVNETIHEVALQWKSVFKVGKKDVVLGGANYHGLGMRFQQPLDPVAEHFFPEGRPDLSGTKQDVSQHKWEAVRFDVPGHAATLALFGHPSNAGGDAYYFSMHSPFAYLSATQKLESKPLTYPSGARFQLKYLITLYPEIKTAEALEQRMQQWRKP